MIHTVTLAVRFPVFGNNFYAQEFESCKELTLLFDEKFEALLMPAADHHFSNEVVGLNDQFRFLNDVLVFIDGRAVRPIDTDEHAQRTVLQYLGLDLDAASVR